MKTATTEQRGQHFAVVTTKDDGRRVCSATYPSLREAEKLVDGLRARLPTLIVDVVPVREGTVVAGMTMPGRARRVRDAAAR